MSARKDKEPRRRRKEGHPCVFQATGDRGEEGRFRAIKRTESGPKRSKKDTLESKKKLL